ncbi:MAG: hypothetical protein ABSG68_24280 [Thermoguttaceae bacterium]|jgi:hypothetical protein
MELQKDTLELIQKTACDAQAAIIVNVPGDGRTVYLSQGGELKDIQIQPAPRDHRVHSLADLIAYAKSVVGETPSPLAQIYRSAVSDGGPVVWHNEEGVVLVLDDDDRRDRVTFALHNSRRFLILKQCMKERAWMKQPAFIRLLRIDLALDNLRVVGQFRRLDWETGQRGSSEVRPGADRLGKEIMAKVQGVDELPEELSIPCPVYCDMGEREEYVIRCALEIDAVNQAFQLLPIADELEYIVDLAQASIRARLDAELSDVQDNLAVPVYYGAP